MGVCVCVQVVGPSRVEVEKDGTPMRVVTLKVNANVTSSTIEEIEGRRRRLGVAGGLKVFKFYLRLVPSSF